MRSTVQKVFVAALISLVSAQFATAEEVAEIEESKKSELLSMDVQDFFSLYQEVFSVAKKKQKLREAASAIHVLTSEDIVRSGATTIPDVLRLVPGVQVARISAHKWAITVRGPNEVYGNKLLVLLDNIPIVTPLFNGVFWEAYNIPLDSIERIEVVRGPGAAVWGSRAVTGVINIITKSASDGDGGKVAVGGGTEHRYSAYAKESFNLGENSAANMFIKYDKHDNSEGIAGNSLNDNWNIVSLGAKGDLQFDDKNSLRITNNTFYKEEDFEWAVPITAPPYMPRKEGLTKHFGSLLSFLWTHEITEDSEFSFEWANLVEDRRDFSLDYSLYNTDLDARYRFKPLDGHDFVVGTSFRFYADNTTGSEFLSFEPENRTLEFFRGFFHDEIELVDRDLLLTIGSRFEQNSQVGFSVMPTARLAWVVNEKTSLWTAFSLTDGTASRVNDDVILPAVSFPEETTGLPAIVQLVGNRDSESENLLSYEVGIRTEPSESAYFDLTAFYFKHTNARSREASEPVLQFDSATGAPYLEIPLHFDNKFEIDSFGAEAALNLKLTDQIKFIGSYSFIIPDSKLGASNDVNAIPFYENSPKNMATAQLRYDPAEKVQLDAVLRYVDDLKKVEIDSYTEMDFRAAWKPVKDVELALIGRNLLNSSHEEFKAWTFNPPLSRVDRSVFAQVSYSF